MLVGLQDFLDARTRIADVAVRTGLHRINAGMFAAAGLTAPKFELFVKAESEQPIGSFKLRGAYNMIASIVEHDPSAAGRGFITYSSGNHAQGVAYAARVMGAKAVIVMPGNAPIVKREATAALGAEIVLVGNASSDRKKKAEELAEEFGYAIIPPYDDPRIIAGQGTCGLEIVEQLEEATGKPVGEEVLILSPVSGGGLLSGTATAAKLTAPGVKVWGAEPELAADAKESFETKTLVEWPAEKTTRTIGDGLRTQSLGRLNFEHVLKYVDGIVAVSEEEIFAATRFYLQSTKLVPEPSGAVTLAAALFHAAELPKAERVVVILSGGNIEQELKDQLMAESVLA
ncbi:threonine dehydratase [Granulicella aggregans]|uniref:Threonine dehydratase n=1 Tax=Granulicella aggregans TaxID=474949 RepID=A0A7W8E3K3_9BACT|nr:threonine/serine dehydratase [Granulicella aggregans]MBB5056225.1 threonine dehydratase [Granulicella aggregans]